MIKSLCFLSAICVFQVTGAAQKPEVRVGTPQVPGSRSLEKQTESSVVRDYLKAWKDLGQALEHNDPRALDEDFVGVARDRLKDTVDEQTRSGVRTSYTDQSHDLQIIFYSPEGLSIQMTDTVSYEQKVYDKEKVVATATVHQRYLIVMTPAESRWQVRVFQASFD